MKNILSWLRRGKKATMARRTAQHVQNNNKVMVGNI